MTNKLLTTTKPKRPRNRSQHAPTWWNHSKKTSAGIIVLSEANESHATLKGVYGKAARHRAHRNCAFLTCEGTFRNPPDVRAQPITVILTRLAPKKHAYDAGDNLNIAYKSTRDGIADWLGVNDRHSNIRWAYRFEESTTFGTLIEIVPNTKPCEHCGAEGWVQG